MTGFAQFRIAFCLSLSSFVVTNESDVVCSPLQAGLHGALTPPSTFYAEARVPQSAEGKQWLLPRAGRSTIVLSHG